MDCALSAGLFTALAAPDAPTHQGRVRLFAMKAARPGLVAHDPPPPRA
ncbi:MAG: hypothetical protein HLUCCA04_04425 [Oceanicaulis sp. HLUCCA04]|nr:MAG: hypothetical protein HLUCCA04_04425 [Oceanicaulis sp. HLUCCA04]